MTETANGRKGRPLKEKISITLDEDVVAKTKALAEEDERSFSQYINRVLRVHILDCEEDGE